MNELNDRELRILQVAREELSPHKQDRARVAQGLSLALGGAAAASLSSVASTATAAHAGTLATGALKVASVPTMGGSAGLAGLSLSAGKLLLLGAGGVAGVAVVAIASLPQEAETNTFPATGAQTETTLSPLRAADTSKEHPEEAKSEIDSGARALPSAERRDLQLQTPDFQRMKAKKPVPPQQSLLSEAETGKASGQLFSKKTTANGGALSDELVLLVQARRALAQGDGAGTLKILGQLATKHPRGTFIEERRATRVLALCSTGQTRQAKEEALRFFGRWTSSVYGDRLRDSCAGK